MTKNYLSISIPRELQKYTKFVKLLDNIDEQDSDQIKSNFGVKLIQDKSGNLVCTAYYDDTGELIKQIFYNGSSISSIKHFRNNLLYSEESFITGKITKKSLYNQSGNQICLITYQYNRSELITCIQKLADNLRYAVEYGYDDLLRVNSRTVKINGKILNRQMYRYDILDRIVEYKDDNQCITVHKVNQKNDLICYTIVDAVGNKIIVNNKFMCSEYIGTEIELNDHKTTIVDKSYIDNIMLKRPFTSEDDLDFAVTNLMKIPKICSQESCITKRDSAFLENDISNLVINSEMHKPISADKINLLKLK